jgi:DNA-binding transcriptional regulator YdaS (Cro superfamily)
MIRIDEGTAREMLSRQCADVGGQQAWADLHNVTPQFVCDVIKGRRNVTNKIAYAMGLRRIILFERAKD